MHLRIALIFFNTCVNALITHH